MRKKNLYIIWSKTSIFEQYFFKKKLFKI